MCMVRMCAMLTKTPPGKVGKEKLQLGLNDTTQYNSNNKNQHSQLQSNG